MHYRVCLSLPCVIIPACLGRHTGLCRPVNSELLQGKDNQLKGHGEGHNRDTSVSNGTYSRGTRRGRGWRRPFERSHARRRLAAEEGTRKSPQARSGTFCVCPLSACCHVSKAPTRAPV